MTKFKSLYNRPDAGLATELDYQTQITKQSAKDECDAKQIVARHKVLKGYDIFDNFKDALISDDVVDLTVMPNDYVQVQNQLNYAQKLFMDLPAKTRKYFNNNSREFLKFTQNPENIDELVRLGLATQRPVENSNVKQKNENIQNNDSSASRNVTASKSDGNT